LNDVLADGPLPAKQVIEEADDAGIAEKTLRRAKKLLNVIVYRESTTGDKRGAGRWMWKLPVVKLVEDNFQDSHQDIQGGQDSPKENVGHLEQVEGSQTRESGIGKPDVQDGHVASSRWPDIQDGQRSSLPEDGYLERPERTPVQDGHLDHLKECGHGYPDGKGCYLCDPHHPYRKEGSAA
jgi:hypothetical protein